MLEAAETELQLQTQAQHRKMAAAVVATCKCFRGSWSDEMLRSWSSRSRIISNVVFRKASMLTFAIIPGHGHLSSPSLMQRESFNYCNTLQEVNNSEASQLVSQFTSTGSTH